MHAINTQPLKRFLAATLLCVCFAHLAIANEPSLTEEAKVQLSSKDRGELVSRALFLFYRNFGDPRLEEVLRAVWELDRGKYPELSWELLDEPEFRINFAQLWAQWVRRRGGADAEAEAIRSYVEPFLSSSNPERKAAAVNFLGAVGRDADIPLLVELAMEDRRNVSLNAVLAIRKIGGENAARALRDLESKIADPVVKDQIKTIRNKK